MAGGRPAGNQAAVLFKSGHDAATLEYQPDTESRLTLVKSVLLF
jgi:hypothetical protein